MDKTRALEIGSIVTVCSPESPLKGFQGTVLEASVETISVKFGRSCNYLFDFTQDPDKQVAYFKPNELTSEFTWNPEQRVVDLYGKNRNYHSLYMLTRPIPAVLANCTHHDHKGKAPVRATRTILINFWGSVYEYPTCKEHEIWDGKLIEVVPFSMPDEN